MVEALRTRGRFLLRILQKRCYRKSGERSTTGRSDRILTYLGFVSPGGSRMFQHPRGHVLGDIRRCTCTPKGFLKHQDIDLDLERERDVHRYISPQIRIKIHIGTSIQIQIYIYVHRSCSRSSMAMRPPSVYPLPIPSSSSPPHSC